MSDSSFFARNSFTVTTVKTSVQSTYLIEISHFNQHSKYQHGCMAECFQQCSLWCREFLILVCLPTTSLQLPVNISQKYILTNIQDTILGGFGLGQNGF